MARHDALAAQQAAAVLRQCTGRRASRSETRGSVGAGGTSRARQRWPQAGGRHHHQPQADEAPARRAAEPDDPEADAGMRAWLELAKWGGPVG